MYAHVYPITKLPRRFSYFDYSIPEGMFVDVGDLVLIPLRGRLTRGIVCGLFDSTQLTKVLPVEKVLVPKYLNVHDIMRIDEIAKIIAQAPSSIFEYAVPTMMKRDSSLPPAPFQPGGGAPAAAPAMVTPDDVNLIREVLASKEQFLSVGADKAFGIALAVALAKKAEAQMLVLVPSDRDAELAMRHLAPLGAQMLTGKQADGSRAAAFAAWREGKLKILVGTKQASLWFPKKLSHVLVLEAGSSEYAQQRRNPRFDPREAAKLLAGSVMHKARFIAVDALPRPEDVRDAGAGKDSPTLFLPTLTSLDSFTFPKIINLRDPQEKSTEPLLSTTLLEAIKSALLSQKRVLLYVNRKGVAKRLQCGGCGQVPLCGTCGNIPTVRADDLVCDRCGTEMWIPEVCPVCKKAKIKFMSIGGEKVAASLAKLFPEASIASAQKEQDTGWDSADIIVATEHFFANLAEPFAKYNFGLAADLVGDLPTHGIDFRAQEETSRKILRLALFAHRQKAQCMVQSWIPNELADLLNPTFVLERELDSRAKYHLPPFGTIVTMMPEDGEPITQRLPMHAPEGTACRAPTDLPDSTTITTDTTYGTPPRTPRTPGDSPQARQAD